MKLQLLTRRRVLSQLLRRSHQAQGWRSISSLRRPTLSHGSPGVVAWTGLGQLRCCPFGRPTLSRISRFVAAWARFPERPRGSAVWGLPSGQRARCPSLVYAAVSALQTGPSVVRYWEWHQAACPLHGIRAAGHSLAPARPRGGGGVGVEGSPSGGAEVEGTGSGGSEGEEG